MLTMSSGRTGAIVALLAGSASAQTCQPQWDTTAGNPGISNGYAAPVRGWNDGSGDKLFVGGSFMSAGGSTAGQYLARWNASNNTWSPVGSGISGGFTNAFMTSLQPFNPGGGERLVAGGFFDTAGGVANTASLAMWNGTTWEAMGTGWTGSTRGSIWSMAVWNGRLYVGGGVVNQPGLIAGLPWTGFASWDGHEWDAPPSAMAGFSPYIGALQVFNDGSGDALFAAGRFTSLNGVTNTSLIAKWTGTAWAAVGGGLTSTSTLFGLEGLTVFDDGGGQRFSWPATRSLRRASGPATSPSGTGRPGRRWAGRSAPGASPASPRSTMAAGRSSTSAERPCP
jgi:hypothetical protein